MPHPSKIIPFRRPRRRRLRIVPTVASSFAIAILIAFAVTSLPSLIGRADKAADFSASADSVFPHTSDPPTKINRTFRLCRAGAGANCVIDGDTFRLNGRKIRITGIDAPEIHPSHCAREERLGQAAKLRLLELLNAGAFELRASGRDHDPYGRDLRKLYRGGTSLGDILVQEGLARRWTGHHLSWCE